MNVLIEKLVTGGQGLGTLPDGRKIFVWNALPGEIVEVEILREKRSFAEGLAVRIVEASAERTEPQESSYIATSPWQMMSEAAESRHKSAILFEQFGREHLETDALPRAIVTDGTMYGYRNKVEFSFAESSGLLQLAVTGRRSHEKIVVVGSALAKTELNQAASDVLGALRQLGVSSKDLGTLTLRCSAEGVVAGVLVVRTPRFAELPLPTSMRGLQMRFVNGFGRKHQTKVLQILGDSGLVDTLLGVSLRYAANSFFQVNLPMYEMALLDVRTALVGEKVVELYAGVGSIGLTSGARHITLVDIDVLNTAYAKENIDKAPVKGQVITSSSEKALEYITADASLIVDPPRAGLSPQVISRILYVVPPQVVYLSCDPATLTRDLAKLVSRYQIKTVKAYNFFPRTPHIETLVILEAKEKRQKAEK